MHFMFESFTGSYVWYPSQTPGTHQRDQVYPFEGNTDELEPKVEYDNKEWWPMRGALQFGGYGHTLYCTARKVARVSHSTSNAETNAC
eukprot:7569434-Pyramimonas_sp.AAC.1